MSTLPTEATAVKSARRRWRFTIRQLLLAIIVIAVGLVLYREVPDMIRRQVYDDPIPLKVGDKRQIHVRQMAYLPMQHFAFRIHLPHDKEFEICAGLPGEDEVFPAPAATQVIGKQLQQYEVRIVGFTCPGDSKGNTKFVIQGENRFGAVSTGIPSVQVPLGSGSSSTFRRAGFRATDAFPADQRVVLYRQFWTDRHADTDAPFRHQNEHSPGKGLIVWIQPRSPEQKK